MEINQNYNRRNVLLFMLSQAFSIFGSMLVSYAILWKVTLETGSGFMMTLYILIGFLPSFFLSPFAGVWADIYDRKKLIIISDGTIALATLLMAFLFFIGIRDIRLLFVIAFIRTLGGAVQMPAVSALIPQLVRDDELMRMNGLFSSLQSGIMLITPMISGVLLNFAPFEIILLIDFITASIAIIILYSLRINSKPISASSIETTYTSDFKAGFSYLRHHTTLIRFFIYSGLLFISVTPFAMLTPLQVTRTFGEEIWRLTAIEILFSLGYLMGGLLITAWGGFKSRVVTMSFSIFMAGVASYLLGRVNGFWVYITIMGFAGISLPIYNTSATVYLQEKADKEFHGRVFGIFGMISSSLMPMSMMVFGPLADRVKIETILIVSGLALLLVALIMILDKPFVASGQISEKEIQ